MKTNSRSLLLTSSDPEKEAWSDMFMRNANVMSDAALAAQFAGSLTALARGEERITGGEEDPSEGVHQMSRMLLHLSEAYEAEENRPECDVEAVYRTLYIGRLIDSLAEVVGPDFIRERLDG